LTLEGTCAEIDFLTYGVESRGELLQRASKQLLECEQLLANSNDSENFLHLVVITLVRMYVKCQAIIFQSHRDDVEEWVTKRRVWTLMNACLQRPLRGALKFRDEIKSSSDRSELCAVRQKLILAGLRDRSVRSYR